MKTAAVVTVTNGKRQKELEQCVASISSQSYKATHYILCDGDWDDYMAIRWLYPTLKVCYWDGQIGGKDLEGRRWLAAAPHLINEEVTFFCNDDDWYEADHVQTIMEKIEQGYDWAYSFRKVCDQEGAFLFNDNCEALGEASPVWIDPNHHFVDWCMWGMKTECLKQISPVLNNKDIAVDRYFYALAKQAFPKFAATLQHTFNFRLGGGCGVQKEFFEQGNAEMLKRHNGVLPWVINE